MCDPNALTAMQVGAGVNSAIGAYGTASAQKTALGAAANTADINATMAEQNAQTALMAGQKDVQRIEMNTQNTIDTQRGDMAANGIDLSGGGSPGEVTAKTAFMGQTDANTENANAVRQAWGFRTQATNDTNEALTDRAGAAGINPMVSAGNSLLTSASSIAASRYMMSKSGVNSNTSINWNTTTGSVGKL